MSQDDNQDTRKVIVTTPVAIIISGVIIGLSIIATNVGFFGFLGSSPKTAESTGYKFQEYVNIAKEIGIKEKDFKSCLDKFDQAEVDKDMQDGQAAGVAGTPGYFIGRSTQDGNINGVFLPGAFPFSAFQSVIDGLLNNNDEQIIDLLVEINPEITKPVDINSLLRAVSVDDDPVLGDSNAPITIVEFSDYQCPYCKRSFVQTIPSIKSNYIDNGKVKLVYRDFPLTNLHPEAVNMAVAANCARNFGGDSKYFEYHDKLLSKAN